MLTSDLLATVASIASAQGLKVEITATQIILVPASDKATPEASEAASEAPKDDKYLKANYRNGNVYRAWNLSMFSKESQKSLKLFALLFNDGIHAYQIKKMVAAPAHYTLEDVARCYRFSWIKRNVLDSLKSYTSGLVARIKAI